MFLAAALVVCAGTSAGVQSPDDRGVDLVRSAVITGGTLINPAAAPLADAVIVITGARIAQVGPAASVKVAAGAQVVDARGKYVIPGLADMHNHLDDGGTSRAQNKVGNLGRVLAAGVTTVFNPAVPEGDFAKLKAVAAGDAAPYARFFGTGPGLTAEGDQLGALSPKPKTAAEAHAVVQKLKALNADAIKVMRDDLTWSSTRRMEPMPMDVLQAVVDEAHRQGLKVYAHAPQLSRAKEALRAGTDGLLHGIIDEAVDAEFIGLMKKNGATYVPTLTMFEDVADVAAAARRQGAYWDQLGLQPAGVYQFFASPPGVQIFQTLLNNTAHARERLPVLRGNVKRVFDAGVPVVMGSDTGFFGVFLGAASQLEMELMVEAGLTPAQAIGAATIDAARMIGREKEQGTIEAGKLADLLILDADPRDDIRAIRRIYRVVKGGVAYDPARLVR
jgi:imidazolonepropionase-like amidohydrolase